MGICWYFDLLKNNVRAGGFTSGDTDITPSMHGNIGECGDALGHWL